MYVVLLNFAANKARAGDFMAGHKAWLKRGFDEGARSSTVAKAPVGSVSASPTTTPSTTICTALPGAARPAITAWPSGVTRTTSKLGTTSGSALAVSSVFASGVAAVSAAGAGAWASPEVGTVSGAGACTARYCHQRNGVKATSTPSTMIALLDFRISDAPLPHLVLNRHPIL